MAKILLVEDEVQSQNIFFKFLEAQGFDVIDAENGVVGIQKAQQYLPDLVICDFATPKLDGYGVLKLLRQNPTTAIIPFIFISEFTTKAQVREAMVLGADDYLTKPCTVNELLEAIATQLKKQAILKEYYVAQCQQILTALPNDISKPASSESFFPTCPKLKEVFDFIEANYQESIGLTEVAIAVGYSPAYLTDLVKRHTGRTLNRWIIERRMKEACLLLKQTDQSIEEIAEAIGYRYVGCFFRQFRLSFGVTPQVWRNQQEKLLVHHC